MDSEQKSKDGSKNITDERINTITSLVGSMLSVMISTVILQRTLMTDWRWYELTAVIVYCLGLINLFVMSTLHHGLKIGTRTDAVFRTLDYVAIFWLIAGTVTAIVAFRLPSSLGISVLAGTWLVATVGIALRASLPNLERHITNTLFITLGWLPAVLLLALEGSKFTTNEMLMLATGGCLFSIGFVIYVSEKPNPLPGVYGFHEIWHILVVIAAHLHAILLLGMIE